MELVIMELDIGMELDATECVKVAGVELVDRTDLGNGRSRWMELVQPRQEARVRAGRCQRAVRAEFVLRPRAGAHNRERRE
jgi:hypothetical protein